MKRRLKLHTLFIHERAHDEDQPIVPGLGSAANQPRNVPASRLEGTGKPTVWSEFGALAAETGAVNLGQGFPDWQPPEFVVEQAMLTEADLVKAERGELVKLVQRRFQEGTPSLRDVQAKALRVLGTLADHPRCRRVIWPVLLRWWR